ncbi:MAG: hypothetical protein R3F39_24665 [Myxococcota bacterium]
MRQLAWFLVAMSAFACDGGDNLASWHSGARPVQADASPETPPTPGTLAQPNVAQAALEASPSLADPAPPGGGETVPDGPPTASSAPWPLAGEFAISEILPRPSDSVAGARAWLELVNRADAPRSLDGCELSSGGAVSLSLSAADAAEAGAYVLVATAGAATAADDGLPAPDVTVDGELKLGAFDSLELRCGSTEIFALPDALLDPSGREAGVALQRDAASPWEPVTVAGSSPAAATWCDALPTYGPGGRGTPGEPNLACDADVDWCRLMYPALVTAKVGVSFLGRIEVAEPGITDGKGALPADFVCQLGLAPDGADPEGGEFIWTSADADPAPPANLASPRRSLIARPTPTEAGIADLAARCTKTGGVTWLYCDLDGSQNGYSTAQAGHALILAP